MSNENCFISVIVPVYNKEEYLRECIDSVLSQTSDKWEMILVDDGSTDGSGHICDEYAGKYEKIKVIHKSNSGQFETRMAGIMSAQGMYCTGLDADDYYEKDCIELLTGALSNEKPDVLAWNMRCMTDGVKTGELTYRRYGKYTPEEFLSLIVEMADHSFCNKAIKTSILQNTDYSDVPVHLRDSEDYMLIVPAICRSSSVSLINETLYDYRQVEGSVSGQMSVKRIMEYFTAFGYVREQISKYGMLTDDIIRSDAINVLQLLAENLKQIYRSGKLSKEEIVKIKDNPYYRMTESYEKKDNLSSDRYMVLKLFRCGLYGLLRMFYKLKG